jgi:hypothetical protein
MEFFRRRGHRAIPVNGGQRAQLANGQFPQKPAGHRRHLYKKNFVQTKDKKISLILQTGVLLASALPTGMALCKWPRRGR